jgi:pimeloyl-ACP methyl ester carboxylesterase
MTLLRLIFLVLLGLVVCGLAWKVLPSRTLAIGGPNPIAQLIPARIGGMTQWVLIRGADRTRPILLWLHGGPGSAQMPLHHVSAALERDFVVVHWDQRGAGKSNARDFDPATMTMDQFLSDAREVTTFLRERVGEQPIIVLGHSWGTMLGARLVARWPEDYAGYIGVGQQIDTIRGAEITLDWLRQVAPEHDLTELPPQSFRDHALYVQLMHEVEAQGGGMNVSLAAMLPQALAAPEYRLADYLRWLDGANRGSGPMWAEYLAGDLMTEVPTIPVPMLLISGARDMNTPVPLVRDWFEGVEAPHGKRMELFDASGHAPFLTETERFVETVRRFGAEVVGSEGD